MIREHTFFIFFKKVFLTMSFPMKSYSLRFFSLSSGSEVKIYPDPEVTQRADKTFDLTIPQNDMEKSVSKNPNATNYLKKKTTTRIGYHEKTNKLAKSDLKIQKRRKYTPEFKHRFVNYIVNDGLTKKMVIKKFNVPYSTAAHWIQLALQNSSGFIKIPKKTSEP